MVIALSERSVTDIYSSSVRTGTSERKGNRLVRKPALPNVKAGSSFGF